MSLSLRAVAIQGIGFSPIHVALQGLIAFIEAGGETDRRPKSTNTLKLQRIKEGRAVALSARATTQVRMVSGHGATVALPSTDRPGGAVCLPCVAKSRARGARARGLAAATPLRAQSTTTAAISRATGGAASTLSNGFATSFARDVTGAGGARASAGGFMSATGHGYAIARGGKNLPDAVLAAVVRATIDTSR